VAASADQAWELLVSRPDLWLGDGAEIAFAPGTRYETSEATGEIRVVKPRDQLRLTGQPKGWDEPATVQLTLSESASGKTAIQAHMEKLPDAESRESMRERWREALSRLAAAVA
jgi:uncharacterized protein YndB with AHSA1/START domain